MFDNAITLLSAAQTATTAAVTGTAYNTLTGTTRAGNVVKTTWTMTSVSASTGGAAYTPVIQVSPDGTAWSTYIVGDPMTATTAGLVMGGSSFPTGTTAVTNTVGTNGTNCVTQYLPVVLDQNHAWIRPVLLVAPTTGVPQCILSAIKWGLSQP
jgi:hypothetical protein